MPSEKRGAYLPSELERLWLRLQRSHSPRVHTETFHNIPLASETIGDHQ